MCGKKDASYWCWDGIHPIENGHGLIVRLWMDYARYDFEFAGHRVILVCPNGEPFCGKKKWIWKTEFFGAFPNAEIEMVRQGYYLVYLGISNLYGCDEAVGYMKEFYNYLTGKQGFAEGAVLFGFSRGGLYARRFAAAYPQAAAAIYLDAPVVDLRSWPGGKGSGQGGRTEWEECKDCYKMTETEMEELYPKQLAKELADFAACRIPLILVAGDEDVVVPYDENGRLIEERYAGTGAPFERIMKKGVGHHPHCLEDPERIVKFLLKHS